MPVHDEPDPWGGAEVALSEERPRAALPARLAGLAALEGPRTLGGPDDPWGRKPVPEELPEIAELAAEGWQPMRWFPPRAPVPAIWPPELRGWVPNRLPTVGIVGFGLRRWVEPARWDHDREYAAFARQAGLPTPPAGRWWLLRSPWPSVGADVVLRLMWRRARELDERPPPRAMRLAAQEMLGWSEAQLWDWWPADQHAAAARAWAAEHQIGEVVADVVAAGIGPAEVQVLVEEGGLTRAQAVAWMRVTRSSVEQVLAWRQRGLPVDPPEGLFSFLALALPEEHDLWTAAGYTAYEAFHLLGRDLDPDDALALRAAGVEAPEAADQLQAATR